MGCSMTMIERVARAMFHAECEPHKAVTGYGDTFGWDDAMPAVRERLLASAAAAIEEMKNIDAWVPAVVSMNWALSTDQTERLYRQVLNTALRGPADVLDIVDP